MDSTNLKEQNHEAMVLDIDSKGSVFYSFPKFYRDSINTKKNMLPPSGIIANQIDFFVTKEYPSFKTTLYNNISINKFAVKDSVPLNWKILNEIDTLSGFTIQKAETEFGGRNWTAWFTSDISIFDGPYKFHGLPGLILKIEDKKHQHQFTFMSIKKMIGGKQNFINTQNLKVKSISNKEFKTYWKEYLKDPAKDTNFLLLNSGKGFSINWEGKTYDTREMMKNAEKLENERIKKYNNFIELNLYK